MSSLLMFAHSLSCSQEEFNTSLKNALNARNGHGEWPSNIPMLDANDIKDCVVGPSHLAFLTHDGRVCRVSYQVDSELSNVSSPKHSSDEESHPTPSKKVVTTSAVSSSGTSGYSTNAATASTCNVSSSGDTTQSHSFSLSGESLNNISGSLGRWASQRVTLNSSTSASTTSVSNPLTMRATTRGRARILRAARGRAGTGWLSSRAVIPASAVPEELISQAQVVLQGKSRQTIIRELQKTSLDVNLAVNNLLSRDDDELDEGEDESYMQETYFPGEDLMSIFDAGIPSDEPFVVQRDAIFPEDIIYSVNPAYSRDETRGTNRVTIQNSTSSSNNREDQGGRDLSSTCVRDRWWGMLLDRNEKSNSSSLHKEKSKEKSKPTGKTTQKFGEVKWWKSDEGDDEVKFDQIASLHSELIAVSSDGFLHQWFWNDVKPEPTKKNCHGHKRAADVKLTDTDKIVKLSAWNIRASILTESGKLATWLDDTLAAVGHKLEHPLQTFSELKGVPVLSLLTCDLYSAVHLSNGSVFWWGVFPFEQRKKILDKVKTKAKKSAIAGSSQIKPGTLVCIRSCPLYYPGAIGFTTVNGEPKVGELMDKAWSITEKCRFKVLEKKADEPTETPATSETATDDQQQKEPTVESPVIGQKRKFIHLENEKTSDDIEEEWYLQDVIFVEDVRHVPVGQVLKVDGAYAMVHFSPKYFTTNNENKESKDMDVDDLLKESVIRRKDELQIVKWTTPPKMPECYQKVPKQLSITSSKLITMSLDNNGIRVILKTSNGLRYAVYSLATGRPSPGGIIQKEAANFLLRTLPNNIRLHPSDSKSVVLLRDPNRCLYPMVKDNVGGIQNPYWTNLSSVTCLATGRKKSSSSRPTKSKSQLAMTLLVIEEKKTIQAILATDVDSLKSLLEKAEQSETELEKMTSGKCDGNRNIFHLCVNMCQPSERKSTVTDPLYSSSRDRDVKNDTLDDALWPTYDNLDSLELLLNSPVLSNHLLRLLSEKDAFGYTPFMTAVRIRAYPAALKIYNTASRITTNQETKERNTEEFMSMIYPNGCDLDMSPLHMLCRNDTCSFTWTGTKHINQDIFECKTCGLVGPLCCCTECAQTCHIGHECKLKRTSPTAYCDCWEKCPCKALLSGDQDKRKELLYKIVEETDLCSRPNKAGYHILLFLAQTVARQASEQEQYVPNRGGSKQRLSSTNRGKTTTQAPPIEHEQEPPKFSKISLTFILKNWEALKSMVMFGCKTSGSRRANMLDDNIVTSTLLECQEIGKHLDSQRGTAFLDNFVHKLIVKCNSEYLDILLQTILYKLQEVGDAEENEVINISRRFVRSVIRVYVVLAACLGTNSAKRKSMSVTLTKCKHVFQSLNLIAAEEIAEVASSLFAPVRMGVVYPSSPFMLGTAPDSAATSDDIFSTPPLPQRHSNQSTRAVRFVEQPDSENVGREESMETDPPFQQRQSSTEETASNSNEMDIDLMAESDTDSEDSNNGDGNDSTMQGTSETRRIQGYFSTAEASETEGEEDDEDDEGGDEIDDEDDDEDDDDDDDDDHVVNQSESNEQRNQGTGENSTPHALQWAVRNSQTASNLSTSSSAAHIAGSGLVLFDTNQLRRSAASAGTDGSSSNSMYCTPSALARTFFMLIREISDLLGSKDALPLAKVSLNEARNNVDSYLSSTWEWLWRVMEETEAKLRFGASLTAVSDLGYSNNQSHDSQSKTKTNRANNGSGSTSMTNPLRALQEGRRKKRSGVTLSSGGVDSPSARQEYLTYILSLMRSHHDEHADSLPKLEVTSMRHVAYILDSFIFYLRSKQSNEDSSRSEFFTDETDNTKAKSVDDDKSTSEKESLNKSAEFSNDDDEDDDDGDDGNISDMNDTIGDNTSSQSFDSQQQQQQNTFCSRFFKRSDSTLTLGHEPTDPFTTSLKEALPLADRPHLLNPTSRRDHLFGVKKQNQNTSTSIEPPMTMRLKSGLLSSGDHSHLNQMANSYLARWHMCLELFGRVFIDDVGGEPFSILNELGRFDVKEAKFKREMEKLRNAHPKDLYLEGLERSRPVLMQQSLRQLNLQFGRRLTGTTPFSVHKLKVSFKEEDGEGTGVARSFYTAISNAFLADEKLPNLENISSSSLSHQLRNRSQDSTRDRRRTSGANLPSGMVPRVVRRNERSGLDIENCPLSIDAPAYVYNSDLEENDSEEDFAEALHKRELGRRLYKKVHAINSENADKITGMILELTQSQVMYFLTRDNPFKDKVNEALELINSQNSSQSNKTTTPSSSIEPTCSRIPTTSETEVQEDNSPLFFQPGKPGYYSPRPGRNTPERLDCFRNVGRIVGLCLLQNELSPLSFNRHVLKYILGRPISWHDLAFYDPTLYESLRQLMEDSKRPDSSDFFSTLDLTFYIQLPVEEGGRGVELVKGGSQVEVSPDNVMKYVKKYAEYRMFINCYKCLQAMKRGVHDVIPSSHLEGLTAEDMRLLLNGVGDINVQQLMNYTFFSDETGGEGQERLAKFKKWFWSVVENMTSKQKQDLLYFWTSSPAMPASAEGFQPMPSVTVKPANDHQLPTANTCISRLYVPLYSSKAILRNKFLLAIKTKIFGFV